jgi:hypothetical protein
MAQVNDSKLDKRYQKGISVIEILVSLGILSIIVISSISTYQIMSLANLKVKQVTKAIELEGYILSAIENVNGLPLEIKNAFQNNQLADVNQLLASSHYVITLGSEANSPVVVPDGNETEISLQNSNSKFLVRVQLKQFPPTATEPMYTWKYAYSIKMKSDDQSILNWSSGTPKTTSTAVFTDDDYSYTAPVSQIQNISSCDANFTMAISTGVGSNNKPICISRPPVAVGSCLTSQVMSGIYWDESSKSYLPHCLNTTRLTCADANYSSSQNYIFSKIVSDDFLKSDETSFASQCVYAGQPEAIYKNSAGQTFETSAAKTVRSTYACPKNYELDMTNSECVIEDYATNNCPTLACETQLRPSSLANPNPYQRTTSAGKQESCRDQEEICRVEAAGVRASVSPLFTRNANKRGFECSVPTNVQNSNELYVRVKKISCRLPATAESGTDGKLSASWNYGANKPNAIRPKKARGY